MRLPLLALSFVVLAAGAANATDICKPHEQSQWLSRDEIAAKVAAMGYEIRKLDTEDGCYEVKGTKDGKRIEAYFDPVTAELVLSK